MSTLIFSVKNGEEWLDIEEQSLLNGFPEFHDIKTKWLSRCYAPYKKPRTRHSVELVRIEFEPVPTKCAKIFQYSIDDTFLDQLVASYAHFGWPIIGALEKKISDSATGITRPARELFKETKGLLLSQIANSLSVIEQDISQFARRLWKAAIDKLEAQRGAFKQFSPSKHVLINRKIANELLSEFIRYDNLSREIEDLERRRKNAGHSDYEPGKNDDLHPDMARAFGKEELKKRAERTEVEKKIFLIYPPAVLVISELSKTLRDRDTTNFKGTPLIITLHQQYLENSIFKKLGESIDGLGTYIAALDLPHHSENLSKDVREEEKGLEHHIAHNSLDTYLKRMESMSSNAATGALFGPFGALLLMAFGDSVSRNPVLGLQHVVYQYWEKVAAREPRSWKRVVLQSYHNALLTEIRENEIKESRLAYAIQVFKVVEAALSIIVFLALVVATDGLLLPVGVASICGWIRTASSAASIGLLAITVLELKMEDEVNKKTWNEALLRLSLEDVKTINSVGEVLSRMAFYRIEISVETVKILIKAKLARFNKNIVDKLKLTDELNVVQHALDLEGLAGDMETVIIGGNLVVAELTDGDEGKTCCERVE